MSNRNALLQIGSGLLLITISTAALAQSNDTTATVPIGDFIGQIGSDLVPWAATALIAVLVGIVAKAFPAVGAFLTTQRTQQVEQLLERALGFAAAQLQTQLKGKELTLDVKNALVKQAVDYAWQHGSKAILDFIGGQTALPDKVQARLLTSPAVLAAQAPAPSVTAATAEVAQPQVKTP